MWEVKTKAIIVSWRTSTRSFFCDGEISAGVPTHIITCNCNNRVVYIQISLHPSFLQVNRYYGISQHFFDNWVMIFLQSYMIIPSSLLPETDNKSMTSKLWLKQWSLLSKKNWVVVAFERVFETVFGWEKNSYLQSWYSQKGVTYKKRSQWESLLYYSNIQGETVYLINQTTIPTLDFLYFCKYFFLFKFRFLFILFHLLFLMGRGLICDSVKKKKRIK